MKPWLGGMIVLVVCLGMAACRGEAGPSGAALFKLHCAGCHPDGGNTVNLRRTLKAADRAAYGIRTAADVAAFIRNPGVGMPSFTAGMIPPCEAKKIGRYVVETFR
ncbi:cytochrome c [Geotalea uraniireducens]|uniref:Cytochrome c n=1 Tax=Geotalea uraniireducens TaxID=351604 RepID=A0ABN6VW16_9BACT|nr:c-type cytochrome [Geotalea uraniireducens]BDV43832.1 cytochrome c [Geotalea uraniireducens]